tara:strand:+ start:436 stop:726 length:291 start_codon:yes stop_codon:yes gene_type:complete
LIYERIPKKFHTSQDMYGFNNRTTHKKTKSQINQIFVDLDMRGELKFFAGVAIGIGIGAATDNMGIGISIGIAFGAALSQTKNKQKSTNSDSSEEE